MLLVIVLPTSTHVQHLQEIVRAKERYEKAQLRKLRALAQLEASSFALTTRSRTRKVVNYNEVRMVIAQKGPCGLLRAT